jgi:hypothetical protein
MEVALPPLLWSFHPTATFYKLVAGRVLPLLPSPAGLFIYSSLRDFPFPFFGTHDSLPSLLCVFFVVVIYYSVFFSLFFPRVGVGLSWGLC